MTAASASVWKHVPARRLALPARWRNPLALTGAGIIVFVVLVAVFGPDLWTLNPNAPIYTSLQAPSWAHPMGTDDLGRDTMARVIAGARVSFIVGAAAIAISIFFGTLLGLISGYYRSYVDIALMRGIDLMFAIPPLILAFLIVGLLGPNRTHLIIAIGIILTPVFARVVRAAVLEVMGLPFVESARALGSSDLRLMRRHLFPNIVAPLTVVASAYFSSAILAEATLSFLGLGIQPPTASWGQMIANGRSWISESVWMSVFPGIAIVITVLGFNLLGDGLRDVLDPRVATDLGDVAAERPVAQIPS